MLITLGTTSIPKILRNIIAVGAESQKLLAIAKDDVATAAGAQVASEGDARVQGPRLNLVRPVLVGNTLLHPLQVVLSSL